MTVSVDRYFNRFLAIEGDEGDGFGDYQRHDSFKSIFLGGGLHLALHNPSRFEPWAHGLFGFSYYNFALPQPPALKSVAMSWVFGGGIDYRIRGGFALRGEGDYVGTHFGGVFQSQPRIMIPTLDVNFRCGSPVQPWLCSCTRAGFRRSLRWRRGGIPTNVCFALLRLARFCFATAP